MMSTPKLPHSTSADRSTKMYSVNKPQQKRSHVLPLPYLFEHP